MSTWQALMVVRSIHSQFGKLGSSPLKEKDVEKGEVDGAESDQAVGLVRDWWIVLVSAGAVASAVTCLVFTSAYITAVSCYLIFVLGPLVTVQKYKLKALKDLRGQNNLLRDNVNDFIDENQQLEETIDLLEENTGRLGEVEKKLQKIADESGTQVDTLVGLLKENEDLLQQVRSNQEAEVIQSILSAVMSADRGKEGSMVLDEGEMQELIMRFSFMKGLTFNEKAFLAVVEKDNDGFTISDFMTMLYQLKHETGVSDEDKVFVFEYESED